MSPLTDFSKRYWLDMNFSQALALKESGVERALLYTLNEYERDWLRVAMAVYVTDRISLRSDSSAWEKRMEGRSLSIRIPVVNLESWSGEVKEALVETLEFFTGDRWEIELVRHPSLRRAPATEALLDLRPDIPFVGLFSGGLDSFAGAVTQALDHPQQQGVMVAASSNSRIYSQQRNLLDETNRQIKGRAKPLVPIHIFHSMDRLAAQHLKGDAKQESSQRSRGFLFMCIGLALSHSLGADSLWVYENGIGAINLPHTPSGQGVDYTRAMNPIGLNMMSNLASRYFDTSIRVKNASLWRTKGEMCSRLGVEGFVELAVKTVSCDKSGRRKSNDHIQCGYCTSCILRRISLAAGGLEIEDQKFSTYEKNLYDVASDARDDKLFQLRAMKAQVLRIRAAIQGVGVDPVYALFREFPELRKVTVAISLDESRPASEVARDIVVLFRRYLRDWEYFETLLPKPHRMASLDGSERSL